MVHSGAWQYFADRLTSARSYWLATTRPDGAPHVAPVWGVVVDEVLYLYSERRTVKARNIAADPRIAIHLDGASDVVIVNGRADDLGAPRTQPLVVAAFDAKYTEPGDAAYLPSHDPDFDVLWALRATSALRWLLDDYDASQVRWSAH